MNWLRRVLIASVVAGVALLPAACTSTGSNGAATSSTTALAATTTMALTPAGKTWGVGRTELTLVDRSRKTAADPDNDVEEKPERTLKTIVLYPTADPDDDGTSADHPMADGRFPLFVFSHGVTASGAAYAPIMAKVAAAGFVVALPTFPLTAGPKGWGNLIDVQNQPADVSFIIDELLARSAGTKGTLAGHLDPESVAVGGHSLGAITSLFFYNSCCEDRTVKAVVATSGTLFPAKKGKGDYDDPPSDLPLLMLHGEKDGTVPYESGSEHIFDEFTDVPRALISFPDAEHSDLLGSPSYVPSLVAFLNLELRDAPKQWQALGKKIADDGDATIQVAGGLPEPN